MSRNVILLLALYALVQIKLTTAAPVPVTTDKTLRLLFHHRAVDDPQASWKNKLEVEHVRNPRDADRIEQETPKCSLEITSEIFYENTPVSCPMLKELSKHAEKNDTTELGFIVDPLANEVNATANLSIAFVNLAIPLKMQCVMWYNKSCSAARHVLPCDLATNYSKPLEGPTACINCVPKKSFRPIIQLSYEPLMLLVVILLFLIVVTRMLYDYMCYKCCNRRQETNVLITFTNERDFDALMEKEFHSMISSAMKYADSGRNFDH